MIKNMKNHYIVCGSGLMARYICAELQRTLSSFVVVSNDESVLKGLAEDLEGLKYIVGDVSDDQVLIDCGIKEAQGLVTAQETDQDNLFTIITARRLNPQLRIISVAIAETSIEKLRYAGADGVVSPNFIGSIRMVSELIRPAAVSFLDIMLKDKKSMFRIAEANIAEESSFAGKTLKDLRLSEKDKVLVLAIMAKDRKTYSYIPTADTVITPGDILVVLGGSRQIQELRKRAGDIR
jgi:voltage-gated potassium channel